MFRCESCCDVAAQVRLYMVDLEGNIVAGSGPVCAACLHQPGSLAVEQIMEAAAKVLAKGEPPRMAHPSACLCRKCDSHVENSINHALGMDQQLPQHPDSCLCEECLSAEREYIQW